MVVYYPVLLLLQELGGLSPTQESPPWFNVGVGTTNPVTLLQVGDDPTSATYGVGIDSTGQGNFTGIVTASSFRATGIVTGSSLFASGFSTFFSSAEIKNDLNVGGAVTATSFVGDITGEVNAAKFNTNSTGIVVSGIATFTDDAQITAGGLTCHWCYYFNEFCW